MRGTRFGNGILLLAILATRLAAQLPGVEPTTASQVVAAGDVRIDGRIPADLCPLICEFRGEFGKPVLPLFGRADPVGGFEIRGAVPPACTAIVLKPGDGRLGIDGNNEFAPGTRRIALKFVTQAALSVDVLFDQPAMADPMQFHYALALVRQPEAHEFGNVAAQRPAAPPGHMTASWHGITHGSFTLQVRLTATGEVIHESEPIEVPKPHLVESRQLPTVDLRGKLQWFEIAAPGMRERFAGGSPTRRLFVRACTEAPWRRWQLVGRFRFDGQPQRLLVSGPIDVAVVGADIASEQHDRQSRGIHLAPKPAPRFTVRVDPAPPRLMPGCTLHVEASHWDFGPRGDFPCVGLPFEAKVGPDGLAELSLPVAGEWQLQLSARRGGGSKRVGAPVELTLDADRANVLVVDPSQFEAVRRK